MAREAAERMCRRERRECFLASVGSGGMVSAAVDDEVAKGPLMDCARRSDLAEGRSPLSEVALLLRSPSDIPSSSASPACSSNSSSAKEVQSINSFMGRRAFEDLVERSDGERSDPPSEGRRGAPLEPTERQDDAATESRREPSQSLSSAMVLAVEPDAVDHRKLPVALLEALEDW